MSDPSAPLDPANYGGRRSAPLSADTPFAQHGNRPTQQLAQTEQISADRRRVIMLVNRTAGNSSRKERADEAARALEAARFPVEKVESPEALAQAAQELQQRESLRCVVAVGGDGTLGAALNVTPRGTPLTILPSGTENLLAGYLRRNRRPEDLVRLVEQGLTLSLDAGVANGRRFSLMASAGFDAEVVRRVHANRQRSGGGNISHLAYAEPILKAISCYSHPRLRVTPIDAEGNWSEPIEAAWLFGVNLPRYASGLRIAPQASGLDGLLDLCLFRRGQLAAGFWYLWHVIRNRHHRLASVATPRVRSCRVESVDGGPIPYQLDGDPGGMLPLELSVDRGGLRLLVTSEVARRLLSV